MKKVLCFAIALLMLLLTACNTPNQPTEPTIPPTEPNKQPETEPTTLPTEPAEPDLSWRPEQTEKLSYEEYFGEDRPYYHSSFWLVETDGVMKGYTLRLSGVGMQVCAYDANPWDDVDGEIVHTVPNSESLWEHSLVGTNGRIACIAEFKDVAAASGLKTAIYLVDLVTGDREVIIQDAAITTVSYWGDVLYYAVYKDDEMQIVRHYIPTGDEFFYPTGQTLVPMFTFGAPVSSDSPIIWQGTTDKMTAAVMEELQNTESQYRSNDQGRPYLWEMEEPWIYAEHNPIHWLCCALQKDTGYHTLYKCEIGTDGSVISEATGIVDSCWYGSDMNHDHYNPDAPAPRKPVSSIGAWQPFVESMAEAEPEMLNPDIEVYQGCYYQVTGNEFKQLTDIPLRSCRLDPSQQAYYAITQDDALIRIYTDGTAPTVLYQGQNGLGRMSWDGTKIYISDGNTIVELDLQTQQWRTVFTHEDLSWFYCDYENENTLYIDLVSGLHIASYLYDLTTGKLTETNFRL